MNVETNTARIAGLALALGLGAAVAAGGIPSAAADGGTNTEHRDAPARVLALRQHGIVACLRDSAGQAIDGGCGQLRARTLDGTPAVRRVLRAD